MDWTFQSFNSEDVIGVEHVELVEGSGSVIGYALAVSCGSGNAIKIFQRKDLGVYHL